MFAAGNATNSFLILLFSQFSRVYRCSERVFHFILSKWCTTCGRSFCIHFGICACSWWWWCSDASPSMYMDGGGCKWLIHTRAPLLLQIIHYRFIENRRSVRDPLPVAAVESKFFIARRKTFNWILFSAFFVFFPSSLFLSLSLLLSSHLLFRFWLCVPLASVWLEFVETWQTVCGLIDSTVIIVGPHYKCFSGRQNTQSIDDGILIHLQWWWCRVAWCATFHWQFSMETDYTMLRSDQILEWFNQRNFCTALVSNNFLITAQQQQQQQQQ